MKSITEFNNASCINCGDVKKYMWRVGAFIMCGRCRNKYFPNFEYDQKTNKYKKFLEIYQQKT